MLTAALFIMFVVSGTHVVIQLWSENTSFIIFHKVAVRTLEKNYCSNYKIGEIYSNFSLLF